MLIINETVEIDSWFRRPASRLGVRKRRGLMSCRSSKIWSSGPGIGGSVLL